MSPEKETERVEVEDDDEEEEEEGEEDEEEAKKWAGGPCIGCGEVAIKLLAHPQCPEGTDFNCWKCGKEFKTENKLNTHKIQKHVHGVD